MNKEFEICRWPYLVAWPFLQIVVFLVFSKKKLLSLFGIKSKVNSIFFDGLGETCNLVKQTAGESDSMNEIYNYKFRQIGGIKGWISDFHQGCLNCQAVRNRFRLDKIELKRLINSINNDEIRILSLASGTAQALIEVIAEMPNRNITAMLVDVNQKSLNEALELGCKYGISHKLQLVCDNAFAVEEVAKDFRPNIVEIIGLMEYLLDEEAIELFRRIKNILPTNSFLITSSICNNLESRFVTWVIDWPMVYRESRELQNLIYAGGFKNVSLKHEPLHIHSMAVAQ